MQRQLTLLDFIRSGVRVKAAPGADLTAIARRMDEDPRINLSAVTEPEYYKEQSAVANQLRALGMVVAI